MKNDRIDEAKITGMTPPVFTFSGMCVLEPPYCRRPTTRLAYCTVIRRWPRSTKMIAPITTTAIATQEDDAQQTDLAGLHLVERGQHAPSGSSTTMPAKISSDMPLPMPRSVICSPSHMMNIVPVVSVSTHISRKPQPGLKTSGSPPARSSERSSQIAIAERLHDRQHQRQVARCTA